MGRDEFFYVLEGEVVRIDDERHTARAGTFAFVPRETIHGFHNASSDSATIWSCIIPPDSSAFSRKCSSWLLDTEAKRNGPH